MHFLKKNHQFHYQTFIASSNEDSVPDFANAFVQRAVGGRNECTENRIFVSFDGKNFSQKISWKISRKIN